MPLHAFQPLPQAGAERIRIIITEKDAKMAEPLLIFGQELGLLVMQHLQAMLQLSQIDVGIGQFLFDGC